MLLTGASGQVGTEFRRRAGHLQLLAPPRSEFDLARPETLTPWLEAHRPRLIVNAGAYTAVDRAEEEEALAFRVNAASVGVLASYAGEANIPLLHLSTDYVFDGTGAAPYRETDVPHPASAYGRSKGAGESAARLARRHAIFRLSWVFASHGSNFVRTMLRLAREGRPLRVVDDQVGGPTWAGHAAEALLAWIGAYDADRVPPSGTWHVGGTPHTSWHAFAREVFEQAHRLGLIASVPQVQAIPTHEFPTRAKRPANSRLDDAYTRRKLRFLPPADWREGLAKVLAEIAHAEAAAAG